MSHMPDRTWLSDKPTYAYGDHAVALNSSFAGQAPRVEVGTKPTIFQFRLKDGSVYPEIVEAP